LRVKAKKHRKLKAAKKASTPKNKNAAPTAGAEEDDIEDEEEDMDGNAEAGPSSPRPVVLQEASLNGAVKEKKKAKKDKGKAKAEVEVSTKEDVEEGIVPGGANDEETAKEQRRAEKRAKREARHAKREKEAAEEAEREREKPQLLSTQPVDDSDSDDEEDVGSDSDIDGLDSDDMRSLSGSPPPLEAFPLPTSAPAPDPSILSRQGLPTGVNDATFIPQDLRLAVTDLTTTRFDKEEPALSDHMKSRLAELDITDFFAVQAYMLPKLLALKLVPWPTDQRNDYLISAPTGSGKTLAYCIPIIEMLRTRTVTRLRAMIVLPTRDLVVQVKETLELLAKGTNLKVSYLCVFAIDC
jgi:ATP-dependent RNA helicase DDX51/DBP6